MDTLKQNRIIDIVKGFFNARKDQLAWKWAEENIYLTEEHGAYVGPFSTDLTPWIRDIIEAICNDPKVTQVTLRFGSQLAKTTIFMVSKCYLLCEAPRSILMMFPGGDLGKSYSEERWQPMVEACAPLRALKTSDRDKYRNMDMHYTNAWLNIVGSNSPAKIASRPRAYIFIDESDKCAGATEKETSSQRNIKKRAKTFPQYMITEASTPTIDTGEINLSYLSGSQEVRKWPCPHCGEFIQLIMEQIKWDPSAKSESGWNLDLVKKSSYYECQNCGGHINDGDKTKCERNAKWVQTNPDAPENHRSFTLASWYAPWPSCSFGETAVKFLKAKEEFAMQDFDNNEKGEPSRVEAKKLDWEILAGRREPYKLGEIPEPVALLTAFCDVQDTWLEWGVIGWGEGSEHWVIEHEIMHGDPSKPDIWAALKETILRKRDLPLDWTFIDYGGHHGQESIEFVKTMAYHKVYLHFGSTDIKCPVNGRATWTKKPRTRLYTTGVGNGKRAVMSMLSTEITGPGYCHISAELDEEYCKQLCAEELRTTHKKGAPIEEWFQIRPRNEALDIHVGCYAGFKRLSQALIKRRITDVRARISKSAPTEPPLDPASGSASSPIERPQDPAAPVSGSASNPRRPPRSRNSRNPRRTGTWMKGI